MWEYLVIHVSTAFSSTEEKATKELNNLAAAGWEVVAMSDLSGYSFTLRRLKK